MATTAFPQQRAGGRWKWVIAGMVIVVLGVAGAWYYLRTRTTSTGATFETTTVTTGNIVATVSGSGTIAAAQSLDLSFQAGGTVTEVKVHEGDNVSKGQVLAQLDTRDLELQVASAQASLDSANAKMTQLQEGNATPEQIAAATASVANAQANAQKTRTGDTTAADIASAQASLRSAQAQLDALKNPSSDKLSSAQLAVTQAQNSLQQTRDSASATKTKAQLDMQKAAEALTQAQSNYSTAYSEWQHVQGTGTDPINPTTNNAAGKAVDNDLNDAQTQQYYQAYVNAESSMRSAEQSLQQAQITYDNARQQEVIDVQNAEAQLADAQKQLEALKSPDQNDIVQAQASVDQAKANLQKLQQGATKADLAAAQATVDQAQANLAELTAPATGTDLQIQQTSVRQAEQALEQAKLALEQATLTAPFDGVVTAVSIVPGSSASSATAAVSLMDRSTLHVDVSLSENDIAQIAISQPVTLTIDALDGWSVAGTVSYISPSATTTNGVVTYPVRVTFPDNDSRVKVGMTANVAITTASKENVIVVPTSALQPKGAGQSVEVVNPDGQTTTEVEVQTGISDDTNTEITSGLKDGDQIVSVPGSTTSGGTSGGRGGVPFGP